GWRLAVGGWRLAVGGWRGLPENAALVYKNNEFLLIVPRRADPYSRTPTGVEDMDHSVRGQRAYPALAHG
ncbi:MAG: hypothetical protein ABI779_03225, partial [Acidobacteriota bacterium]